jgi:hypothetical protein
MALMKPKTKDETETKQAEAPAPVQEAKKPETKEEQLAGPKQDQPIVPAEEASQALAEVHPVSTSNVKQFIQEQAEEGFEGLAIDGFSFDRIKLEDGKFLKGSDEVEIGEKFQFIALSSRSIYVVRQSDDQDAESFYSYDPAGQTKTDGSSAKDILDEWKTDGYGTEEHPLSIRKYLEVFARLPKGDEMVSLSIPPSSVSRFSGKAAEAKFRYNLGLGQVVLEASVGKKAGEGSKAFRPWTFSVIGPVTE